MLLQLSNDGSGRVNATEKYFLNARTLENHHGGFVLIDGVVYGGNGHNNGFPFALDLMSGRMLWDRARGAGTGSAAVTAADGHLYFRYQDGTMALIAVNPKQYQLKSTFRIPTAGVAPELVPSGGHRRPPLPAGAGCSVRAQHKAVSSARAEGNQDWRRQPDSEDFNPRPVVARRVLYGS